MVKKRICKIFEQQKKEINYFNSFPTEGREIIFDIWELDE